MISINNFSQTRTGHVTTWWPASGASAAKASAVFSVRTISTSVTRILASMEDHVKTASTLIAVSVSRDMKAETVKVIKYF